MIKKFLSIVVTLVVAFSSFGHIEASTEVTLSNWDIFEAGMYIPHNSSYQQDQMNYAFFDKVLVGNEIINNWGSPSTDTDSLTLTSTTNANNLVFDINTTGWDAMWGPDGAIDDSPWQLSAKNHISVIKDHPYTLSFDASWKRGNCSEKNIKISIFDQNTNYSYSLETIDVNNGRVRHYEKSFTANDSGELDISILMGAFTYSYEKGYTSEALPANGTLSISGFKVVDNYVEPEPDVKPTPDKKSDNTIKKTQLGQVKGVKVKNTAKKKVKITWKKVSNAKVYQLSVNGKKSKTSKTKKVLKGSKYKKGKIVKVKIRALANGSYTTGNWSKVIKKKMKK